MRLEICYICVRKNVVNWLLCICPPWYKPDVDTKQQIQTKSKQLHQVLKTFVNKPATKNVHRLSKISLKMCSSLSCDFSACGYLLYLFLVQTFRSHLPRRRYTGGRNPYRRASYLGEQRKCCPLNSQDTLITRAFKAKAVCLTLAPRHPDSCQEEILPSLWAYRIIES